MKELIRVRVQYASRQQCCKTHKRPLPLPLYQASYRIVVGALSLGKKRLGRDADPSRLSSTEIKTVRSYSSTFLHVFKWRYIIKDKDYVVSTYYLRLTA